MDWHNVYIDGFRYAAYVFMDDEKALLVAALEKHLPKLEKKVKSIQMNPKNNENVIWQRKEQDAKEDVRRFKKAIETLKSHSNIPK